MGLKILAALLPREYREQVLGDLEERGVRPSDIVNVLPGVWTSHLRRSLFGPPPDYTATESTMGARAGQLRAQRVRWVALWAGLGTGSICLRSISAGTLWGFTVGLLAGALVFLALRHFMTGDTGLLSLREEPVRES